MAKKRKNLSTSRKMGRPTVMTPVTIQKLEQAFLLGCSKLEACFCAGICQNTLNNYIEANPDFLNRIQALKQRPIFLARKTIIDAITNGDTKTAMWFLERKRRAEFGRESKITAEVQHDVVQPIDMNDWAEEQNSAFLGLESEEKEVIETK